MQVLLRRTYGINVNHKRVYRLTRKMNLQAVIPRKKPYVVYSKQDHEQVLNVINRDFETQQPNRKWATDITYLTVNGQRLYLSAILDLFNNEIVTYNIGRHPRLELVIQTLHQAAQKRDVRQAILHSDQGGQYTSRRYRA